MVDDHGLVKVLDFGLAKLVYQGAAEDEATASTLANTEEGTILGTPAYLTGAGRRQANRFPL